MRKLIIILLLIPILSIWQNFTTKFKTDNLEYRIDSTNTLLSKFYFESCGISIPSQYVGFKFDNPNDFACTGGLPSTTELVDFQLGSGGGSSTPSTPIPMTNQSAVQSFINSNLLPDIGTAFSITTNANDIIYIYDAVNDEVQVWYNTNVAPATLGTYSNNFVVSPLGANSGCDKPIPQLSITTAPSGGNALLVKVCEPLNVVTSIDSNLSRKVVSIDNWADSNTLSRKLVLIGNTISTSPISTTATFGSVAESNNLYTTTQSITTTTAIEIVVENTGSANTTIVYGGITLPLNAGIQRIFTSKWDESKRVYTPISSLTVNGTATSQIFINIKKIQ